MTAQDFPSFCWCAFQKSGFKKTKQITLLCSGLFKCVTLPPDFQMTVIQAGSKKDWSLQNYGQKDITSDTGGFLGTGSET